MLATPAFALPSGTAPSPPLQVRAPAAALAVSSAGLSSGGTSTPSRAASQALAVAAASLALLRRVARQGCVARRISRKQWNDRVKRIQDYRAVFDVTIPKPMGVVPKNFPTRPGVGIAQIKKDGNAEELNRKVLLEGFESMFVLEGDEVVAVDGIDCERMSLDFVGPLVKGSKGDSVTLTLCRNYQKGPVKVIWMPGEEMITMKRGTLLKSAAEAVGADVRYRCKDGWCSSCWHTEETSDLVHRICKFNVPKDWDSVKPLQLLRADYAFQQKGLLVKHLMQADGYLPPPPLGVNVKAIRQDVEDINVSGL